jgi:hypothetical protein
MKYPSSREIAKFERSIRHLGLPKGLKAALDANGESLSTISGISRGESNTAIYKRRRKSGISLVSSKSARRTKIA